MGFSLGAAATLQYLEDFHDQSELQHSELDAAMTVSPPWSFSVTPKSFDIWSMLMTLPLKAYMLKHRHVFNQYKLGRDLNILGVLKLKDIHAFNQAFFRGFGGLNRDGSSISNIEEGKCDSEEGVDLTTIPRDADLSFTEISEKVNSSTRKRSISSENTDTLQYNSVEEYYEDCSAVLRAHLITTPTLSISSKDDPICPHEDCPITPDAIGPGLIVVKTKLGGHLAFPENLLPLTKAWTDKIAVEWFKRFL